MAGQGGPVRRLPTDPFGFMLASLPAPGGPPLPQLPTIGPAPSPAPRPTPTIGPAPPPTPWESWTDPEQLAQALQDLTRGLWTYGTHPAESFGKAAHGGAQAAQGLWELPGRAGDIAQGLGQVGASGAVEGILDYLKERAGTPTQAVQTALTDPVGALLDLPVDPVAPGLLTAGALIAKPGKAAATAGRMVEGMPGFYSRSVRAAEQLPERINVQSVMNALRKYGAPAEELLNLEAALPKAGQVAREEVIAALESKLPKLNVEVRGSQAPDALAKHYQMTGKRMPTTDEEWMQAADSFERQAMQWERNGDLNQAGGYWQLQALATDMAESTTVADDAMKPPKWNREDMVLPGGDRYRERLLTLPRKGSRYEQLVEELTKKYGEGFSEEQLNPLEAGRLRTEWEEHQAGRNYHPDDFVDQGHWGQTPNVVGWTRENERALATAAHQNPELVADIGERLRVASGAKRVEDLGSGAIDNGIRKGVITPEEGDIFAAATWSQYPVGQEALARLQPQGRLIEEIQSQWHQSAYDKYKDIVERVTENLEPGTPEYIAAKRRVPKTIGYEGGGEVAGVDEMSEQLSERWRALRDIARAENNPYLMDAVERAGRKPRGASINLGVAPWDEMPRQELLDQVAAYNEMAQQFARERSLGLNRVPDAPFKENWPDLLIKNQLQDIATNRPELEWMGWTTGDTQNARWSLAKRISRVYYLDDGTLRAFNHGGGMVFNEPVPKNRVKDYVGKEVAERLLAQPEREVWRGNGEIRTGRNLSGLDLEVGGEGMKQFYDQLIPKRVEAILRKFGDVVIERGFVKVPEGKEPIWLVRLPEELKARIRTEGLPLAALAPFLLADDQGGQQ